MNALILLVKVVLAVALISVLRWAFRWLSLYRTVKREFPDLSFSDGLRAFDMRYRERAKKAGLDI